ncbi:hypothetical protein [Deinococcus enclensis]|uniref:Lipoprotein n=1 Tax=Deinococcus enclensis TaxID=1049582 RepID=A0ABT9MG14_9DEIO|nr:hypothetical protein [Deinococcus enclensis]MDP9765542.1 hypothetical protein [Deinococcus enclensis]
MNHSSVKAGLLFAVALLTGCDRASGTTEGLVFSEDDYRQACQAMREQGKPTPAHINYLTYTPGTAEQEGPFMVGVLNPLAAAQMECGSIVFDAEGRPEATAVPEISALKSTNDNTFKLMVTGYTREPEAGDPAVVTVFLRNDSGDRHVYPSAATHAFAPAEPGCVGAGCGHVYNKFVSVTLNEVDAPLFTSGQRGLVTVNWRGQVHEYAFDVPTK